jgi:hypothetical protein
MKQLHLCLALLIAAVCRPAVAKSDTAMLEEKPQRHESDTSVTVETRNFVTVSLPRGVTVELPKNWIALTPNSRTTVDTAAEALSKRSDTYINSELPFAANLYDDFGKTIAIFNIRYYPDLDITQQDVLTASEDDILQIDQDLRDSMSQSASATGFTILTWGGTRKVQLNGNIVLVTEYRRSFPNQPSFRVRLVRMLNGEKSFTITISYQEKLGVILAPVTDYCISTIRTR